MEFNECCDKNAEKGIIASILLDNSKIIDVKGILEPDDFSDSTYKFIFEGMIELDDEGKPIDAVTLSDKLSIKDKKFFTSKVGGNYGIVCINESLPSAENVLTYAKLVKEHSGWRKLITIKHSIATNRNEPLIDHISDVVNQITELNKGDKKRDIEFKKTIDIVEANIASMREGNKNITGCEWSSDKLTKATGGMEIGLVYVLGSLKKSGKSKWMIDQTHCMIEQKVPGLILSQEMGKMQLTRWLWSRFSEVDSFKLRSPNLNGGFTDEELYRLESSRYKIEDLNKILIANTKPFLSLDQIKNKIYQSINEIGIKWVFLDYLQRCNIEKQKNELESSAVERFVTGMADIAKNFNVALVFLSQIVKVAENKFATIKDLRGAGAIAEGVDCVMIMNRESRVLKHCEDERVVHFDLWQRDAPDSRVTTLCDLSIGKFADKLEVPKEVDLF